MNWPIYCEIRRGLPCFAVRASYAMTKSLSACGVCRSSNILELVAESCLHFPGLNGLKTEPILIYSKIVVCFDCGLVQSRLSNNELKKVREGAARLSV